MEKRTESELREKEKQKLRDWHYMELAKLVATQSKCPKAQYGAIIIDKNDRIVATGRNGKPQGSINDGKCYRLSVLPNSEKSPCCLHAEANCLMYCDRHKAEGGTMYVNGVPCRMCALTIMQSGIKRLVYLDAVVATGHKGDSDDEFWNRYGVGIERVALEVTS